MNIMENYKQYVVFQFVGPDRDFVFSRFNENHRKSQKMCLKRKVAVDRIAFHIGDGDGLG